MRKKDFQALMKVQSKTISRWFARGLPRYNPSVNVCYIDIEQAISWFEQQENKVLREHEQKIKELLLVDRVVSG